MQHLRTQIIKNEAFNMRLQKYLLDTSSMNGKIDYNFKHKTHLKIQLGYTKMCVAVPFGPCTQCFKDKR